MRLDEGIGIEFIDHSKTLNELTMSILQTEPEVNVRYSTQLDTESVSSEMKRSDLVQEMMK